MVIVGIGRALGLGRLDGWPACRCRWLGRTGWLVAAIVAVVLPAGAARAASPSGCSADETAVVGACGGKTLPATHIERSSATLHGTDRCDAGTECTAWAEYRELGTTAWTRAPRRNFGAGAHTVSVNVTGLYEQTTYQFQMCGTQLDVDDADDGHLTICWDSRGTGNGTDHSTFTTQPPPPPPRDAAPCVTTGIVWCGNFSTGNISQYTELLGRPRDRVTVSGVAGRLHAGRFEIRPGDIWTDGTNRMQLREGRNFPHGCPPPNTSCWVEGTTVFWRFDMYVSAADDLDAVPQPGPPGPGAITPTTEFWRGLVGWPTAQAGSCSVAGLGLERIGASGNLSRTGTPALDLTGRNNCDPSSRLVFWWLHNPRKGVWYEFIQERRISTNPSVGFFEFWMKAPGSSTFVAQPLNGPNGHGALRHYAATLGCAGCSVNMRLGIYRQPLFSTTDVIFYADVRSTTSFAAAAGSQAPPPQPPPPQPPPPQPPPPQPPPPPPPACPDPAGAFNQGFNTGFNPGFNAAFNPGYRAGFNRGYHVGFGRSADVPGARAQAVPRHALPPACSQSFNQGFNTGFNPGFDSGFNRGFHVGFNPGFTAGFRARHRR